MEAIIGGVMCICIEFLSLQPGESRTFESHVDLLASVLYTLIEPEDGAVKEI